MRKLVKHVVHHSGRLLRKVRGAKGGQAGHLVQGRREPKDFCAYDLRHNDRVHD